MAMRTYGLSGSGMDVDQLVKDLMKARRANYDKMYQQKTQLEWKKADYNSIYTTISEFRTNTVLNYKMQNTLLPKKAVSANEAITTVSANAASGNVSHDISVLQLADGVKKVSTGNISVGDKATLATQFNLVQSNYSFTIKNGNASAAISFTKDNTIYDLVDKINTSNTGIKATYDTVLDRFFMYTTSTGSNTSIEFSGPDASFVSSKLKINTAGQTKTSLSAINVTSTTATLATQFSGLAAPFMLKIGAGSAISIDPTTDTMASLITKINTATNSDVTASYDAALDRFTLTSNASGLAAAVDVSASSVEGLAFLSNNLKLNTTTNAENGKDAVINLDGIQRIAQSGNNFTLTGVTYNLKATGTTKVTISSDTDKLVENVKSLLVAYNKTLATINGELSEARYSNYTPLTDAQKANMKETDIKAWEEKAKSGLLRNDTMLRSLVSGMRSDLSSPIAGITTKYNSAASLGITTGNYSEGGKLYLDEAKLRKAIEADPDAVNKIFGKTGTTSAEQGIAVRLYETLKAGVDRITTEAGLTASAQYDTKSNIAKRIHNYEDRMYNENRKLKDVENRYYRQFDAMETAINKLNSQSSWLSKQLSGK